MLNTLAFFLLAQFAVMTGRLDTGFFSQLDDVLSALRRVDRGTYSGLEVAFHTTPYCEPGRGDNWWNYYFEPISFGKRKKSFILNYSIPEPFSRQEAYSYIQKYIKLQPHILRKVEQFAQSHFSGCRVLCVHYRGTDKITESPRVPYDKALSEIIRHFKGMHKIFLATDEHLFLDYLRSYFGVSKVVSYSEIFSVNGSPIHLDPKNSYQKGEEALIDALLLSRGEKLLRTESNLSRWSTYFNPNIPEYIIR